MARSYFDKSYILSLCLMCSKEDGFLRKMDTDKVISVICVTNCYLLSAIKFTHYDLFIVCVCTFTS